MKSVNLEATKDSKVAFERIAGQGFSLINLELHEDIINKMGDNLQILVAQDLETMATNPNYRDHWMVMNLMFRHQIFADFLGLNVLQDFIEPILGESFITYSFTSSSMPPNGTNFSHRIHNDAARFIPGYTTNVGLIVPLDDFTKINGATLVLPFSQSQEASPTAEEFAKNAVEIIASAGQALLFNARLWHSGGQNRSDKPRNALTLNFCRSFMRQHFDFSKMYEKGQPNQLNAQAQKLIGMKVRMPSSLDEYYVETKVRKYQPGQG